MLPTIEMHAPEGLAEEQRTFVSEHYRLTVPADFDDASDWLALAEALHSRLTVHFGATPPEDTPLEVQFFASQVEYAAALARDGIPESISQAGGVYWTGSRKAYFWQQPSRAFTRHLFLHELVHQFHYLAVMDNQPNTPGWYTEGLAEHFAFHSWDGEQLRTGCTDQVLLESNIPDMARSAREGTLDLLAVARGSLGAPKPESWALVHWLLAGPDAALRKKFRKHEKELWSGKPFDERLLGRTPKTREEILGSALEWLGALETTWQIEWIHWDSRGDHLVSNSSVVSLIRAHDAARRGGIEATLLSEGRSGLVLGYQSRDEFLAVYHDPRGRVWLTRRAEGRWQELGGINVQTTRKARLKAEVLEGSKVRLSLDGETVLELTVKPEWLAGPPGLFADGTRAEFHAVQFLNRDS